MLKAGCEEVGLTGGLSGNLCCDVTWTKAEAAGKDKKFHADLL
jgi:hypothetical protein